MLDKYIDIVNKKIEDELKEIDKIVYSNSKKVLDAFHKEKVLTTDFNSSTGYGYNDIGRDKVEKVFADYLIEDYDRIKEFDIRYISSKPIQDYLYGNGTLMPYDIYHAVESYFERDSYGKKRSAYFTLKKNKRKVYIRRVDNIHLREKNPLLKATFDDEYLDNLARYARQGEEEYDYVMDIIAGSDIEEIERKTTDKHYGVVDSVYDSMKDDITKLELFTGRNIYELRDIANREIKRSGKNTR